MTRYYLDTEFNGFGGDLISLALVNDRDRYLYLVRDDLREYHNDGPGIEAWVEDNVLPIIDSVPAGTAAEYISLEDFGPRISEFIYTGVSGRNPPQIIADWPSDIADFCKLLLTGPGESVPMESQTHFTILRHLDVYPTTLEGAVQHNALWDAYALRQWVRENER